jgi:SAM-dependent methyltransferase
MNTSELNTKFYKEVFEVWNNDPNYFWAGFWYLYPYLDKLFKDKTECRVLDIGCANGRFFNFLEFCFPEKKFVKVGIDFVDFPSVNNFEFINMDISKDKFFDWKSEKFDLVIMFGVYHHIYGKTTRQRITDKVNELLSDHGLFVFTRWNFLMLERLRKHILNPEEMKEFDITFYLDQYELGDYYLKWDKNKTSVRFANMMDVYEIETMLDNSRLHCFASYYADDKLENRNSYFLVQKK